MRHIVAVATAVLLAASSMASAAPAPGNSPKGIRNAKKVMQGEFDRYKRVENVKKKAHAQKEAQRKKSAASAQ